MRNIFILLLALVFTTAAFAQPAAAKHQLTERDYLLKSKRQKTVAWILIGGGFVLSSAGLIKASSERANGSVEYFNDPLFGLEMSYIKYSHKGDAMQMGGLYIMTGSIPFFIASSRNKRKAAKVSLSMKIESRPLLHQSTVTKMKYPALAVKFKL